jgi:hypothetical protein
MVEAIGRERDVAMNRRILRAAFPSGPTLTSQELWALGRAL